MSITVKKLSDKSWRVGSKVVYEDLDGTIISVTELTTAEKEAFYKQLPKRHGMDRK
jgi:hypothetical protein